MPRPRVRFTREDLEQLPEHIQAELHEGDLVVIPAPTAWHEHVVARLMFALRDHLGREAEARVLGSRAEIVLVEAEESALQPDVMVLPEGTRPTGPGWTLPTPVWVAEVLSPSTASRDRGVKLRIYGRMGVREVWIVDPEARTIEVCDLERARRQTFGEGDRAASEAVPGLLVDVARLFAS